MTTSDKRPRRTTKSAKTAKGADAPDSALIQAKPDPRPVAGAASAAPPAPATTSALASPPALGKSANRARSPGVVPNPVETRRIKDVSVTVTSRHHEDRHASIALAAYFRSESRGFAPGHEVEDWLAAEEEVDQRLLGEGRAS
jgi:hypothetical protein